MGSPREVVANWKDLDKEVVREGIQRSAFGTRNVILVMNECTPGMEVGPHDHEFDQIALIISGRAIYTIGDTAHEVGPGSMLLIPAGEPHFINPIGDETVMNFDVFAPTRRDFNHLLQWMPAEAVNEAPVAT